MINSDQCLREWMLSREVTCNFSHSEQFLGTDLEYWKGRVDEYGIGLISGAYNTDVLPITPIEKNYHQEYLQWENDFIKKISERFGSLTIYAHKKDKRLIVDVFPLESDADSQLGSSNNFLEWHVEDGFLINRPDWIILYCVKGDEKVKTFFSGIENITFDEESLEGLKSHEFEMLIDDSFTSKISHTKYYSTLIREYGGSMEIVYDPAYTNLRDKKDRKINSYFLRKLNEAAKWINLQRGDLLIFNNKKFVHARSECFPKYDGNDRWIKRGAIVSN